MSSKDFCDICNKVISDYAGDISVRSYKPFSYRDYCRECFQDKKNWLKIHSLANQQDID